MKRRQFLLGIVATAAAIPGCDTMSSMGAMGSSNVVSSLTSQLGVTPTQATGGVGSILAYAKDRLSPADFGTVSKALPGSDTYLKAAGDLVPGGKIDSMAGLNAAFSKLGMSPDMVGKFMPIVTDYVGKAGGDTAKNLLAAALR